MSSKKTKARNKLIANSNRGVPMSDDRYFGEFEHLDVKPKVKEDDIKAKNKPIETIVSVLLAILFVVLIVVFGLDATSPKF